MLNEDRTLMQGYVTQGDIMRFLVDFYNGDTGFFEKNIKFFENNQDHLFPKFSRVYWAKDSDTLLTVLKMMREHKIAAVPIEKSVNGDTDGKTYTVGISFLSDLMFLFKLPHFYQYLNLPAINLVQQLNQIDSSEEEHPNPQP